MKHLIILVFFTFFLSQAAFAQVLVNPKHTCSYDGKRPQGNIFAFASDDEAQAAISNIMKYTGLAQNFELHASNVYNAEATMLGKQNERRAILYNQTFMMRVKDATKSDWAALSILAHEIGHHLNNHVIGNYPNNLAVNHKLELEADRFSGFILGNMGATFEESQLAMRSIGSEKASKSHPAMVTRLDAIANGWISANNLLKLRQSASGGNLENGETIKEPLIWETPLVFTPTNNKDSSNQANRLSSRKKSQLEFQFIFERGSFDLLSSKYFADMEGKVIEYANDNFGQFPVGTLTKVENDNFCIFNFNIGFFKYCVAANNEIRPIVFSLDGKTEILELPIGKMSTFKYLKFVR